MIREIAVDNQRLTSMETKIDRIGEALTQLVRLEVKHEATVDRLDRLELEMTKVEENQVQVRTELQGTKLLTGMFERIGWILATAVVGIVSWVIKGFLT